MKKNRKHFKMSKPTPHSYTHVHSLDVKPSAHVISPSSFCSLHSKMKTGIPLGSMMFCLFKVISTQHGIRWQIIQEYAALSHR